MCDKNFPWLVEFDDIATVSSFTMNKGDSKYVALNISSSTLDSVNAKGRPRRSIWRWWNQLSRFQRTLLYVILAGTVLTVLYLWNPNNAQRQPVIIDSSLDAVPISPQINTVSAAGLVAEKDRPAEVEQQEEANEPAAEVVAVDNRESAIEQLDLPPSQPIKFKGKCCPTNDRQKAVIASMRHAWKGYKQFAWGHDHLKPISEGYHDWFYLGLTIVDSADTLCIMNMKEEFNEAKDWIATHLNFDKNRDVNLFEVTIRVLGGLLSSYHLSGDRMFLEKALDLGERLLPCFESPSGVPFSDVNLANHKAHSPKWSPDSSTSEVTTIQLEFRDLSRSSGDRRFEDAASKVSAHVHTLPKTEGLVPIFINANTGQFRLFATITLGARGDSYYEYLLKQWIQTGKSIEYLREDYLAAIAGVRKMLVRYTNPNKLLFIGELQSGGRDFKPKMDHLVCYLPGTLALGVHNGLPQEHMKLAEDLLYTCYQTYAQQPTFLAPEITYFQIKEGGTTDMYVKVNDAHNLLRPEFIESLWYMYQLTGNTTFQDWGWQIFQAFEKYTKVSHGYTSINNVKNAANVRPKDMMESFFLSETLKYFYLLFSDDRKSISLDDFVFNSEAHPLPIYRT
ncbi:hypothetical protein B566_EDAN000920 [Ephemera danica]|nr:hypothetical protein B566_EDAN000920 [Ephemera danica]